MFAMKYIFKKTLIQLFLHIAAKKMVSSTHKALTPNMGFSRHAPVLTLQLVQTQGVEGSVLQAAPTSDSRHRLWVPPSPRFCLT